MGKPTGFIEYLRELPVDRTPIERVRDWKEFHHHMDEKRLRNQAARCMDCGVPFCHTGTLISGMASGCHPGLERPRLPRPLGRGDPAVASHEQLPRVHRPPLSGAVRRIVRARHQHAAGRDQERRERDHRPWLGTGLGRPRSTAVAHWEKGGRDRLGSGGSRGGGTVEPRRPHRDGARARRSSGRPADLRHSEHEAG